MDSLSHSAYKSSPLDTWLRGFPIFLHYLSDWLEKNKRNYDLTKYEMSNIFQKQFIRYLSHIFKTKKVLGMQRVLIKYLLNKWMFTLSVIMNIWKQSK